MASKEIKLVKVSIPSLKILYAVITNREIMGFSQNIYKNSYSNLFKAHYNNKDNKYFLIKLNNEIVGFMYYKLEKRFNAFEIGGAVIPKKRKKGYATIAHELLIDFLFKKKKAQKIQAIVSSENTKEIKILKKCGFKLEGILRKAGRVNNTIHDLDFFGLLKEDF